MPARPRGDSSRRASAADLRWFAHQVAAVGIPVLVALLCLGLATELIFGFDAAWGISAFTRMGLHGGLAVTRGVAAFGLALLLGAILGKVLPTLVSAALLTAALAVVLLFARDTWIRTLDATVIGVVSTETGEMAVDSRAVTTGWAWRAPDGSVSLEERPGYEPLILGIPERNALAWETYETGAYLVVGLVGLGGATVVVGRRRPL